MENSIDHKKLERINRAKSMTKVPLRQLDYLIRQRFKVANQIDSDDVVELINEQIRYLLAV